MKVPKPSLYQLFLTSLVVLIILILVNPAIFNPGSRKNQIKIGIIDSGCTLNQQSEITEYKTYTTPEYGYSYSDSSFYDSIGHGQRVCDIIIEGTDDVSIYSAKIANGQGQVTYAGLFAAVNYLVEEKDVDIINLSLGGEPYFSLELFSAFEEYASSKIFIAAVGNRANEFAFPEGVVDWPATLPWVVGVGAVDDDFNRTHYSSFGRSSSGLYATEFVDSGDAGAFLGTSFATPRVTVEYVRLWQELRANEVEVTPELLNYYMSSSTQRNDFNIEKGWGRPNASSVDFDDGVRIEGVDEKDPYLRFVDEVWKRSWKIYGSSDDIAIDINGNGTEFIQNQELVESNWGKILTLSINASTATGNYTITISHPDGNAFDYIFELKGEDPEYKVLLDHRNTINGFAHQFGQYARFEDHLRDLGVQIDQIQIGETDLEQYNSVIATEFGRTVELDRKFGREFNHTLFAEYKDYAREGGNLQIMATYPDEFNDEGYRDALSQIGASIGDARIPKNNGEISYDVILEYDFSIFSGVISIGASGREISPVNASQTSLGIYKFIASGVGEASSEHSLGINTTLGSGNIYVWSGSKMLHNDYFKDRLDHYDQVLMNILKK